MSQFRLHQINESSEPHEYRRRGNLIMRKLAEYIPVMIVTNISLLLINTVDQIVAGNFVGKAAMSSISIFYPVVLVIAVFSGPVASGISTTISNALGQNDMKGLDHAKSAGLQIMITVAIAISLIQIPIVLFLINSYGLSSEVSSMVQQYAIGMMICTPLGIVSTIGSYLLQISGKMKVLMALSIIEGGTNVAFDLLYVAVLDMGVAGAGFGTATANFIRCTLTVFFLAKRTDFFKGDGKRATLQDYKNILSLGLPDAAYMLMMAFQNYFTLRIILKAFGDDGGAIYGLCAFCLSVVNVLLFGIQGGMRPLMGLYVGGKDFQGVKELMYHGLRYVLFGAGALSIVIIAFPSFFYHLHGIRDIPEGGLLAVQLYAAAFLLRGFDHVFRLYFSNVKDIRFSTVLTVLGSATLPLFALIISLMDVPSPFIFLAYLISEMIIFVLSVVRYVSRWKMLRRNSNDDIVLYMTVKKDEAVDASRYIRSFADQHGISNRISYRAALCVEEMVAYIQAADHFDRLASMQDKMKEKAQMYDVDYTPHAIPEKSIAVDIIVRFSNKDTATLITLDDGAFIDLDRDEAKQELITDNYSLIKKMATSVEYQYILNMNYTRITFS